MNQFWTNMVSGLLISLVMFVITEQCKDDEDKEKMPSEVTKTCSELNGHSCDILKCNDAGGTALPASDVNSPNVCCDLECSGSSSSGSSPVTYSGGDSTKTCAVQEGHICNVEPHCKDGKYIESSDSDKCCATLCIQRIQAKATFPQMGDVTIEKTGSTYVVFTPPIVQGGLGNQINALPKGGGSFGFTQGSCTYSFKVTESSETEFSVSEAAESCS
jgi:hypothetical protein